MGGPVENGEIFFAPLKLFFQHSKGHFVAVGQNHRASIRIEPGSNAALLAQIEARIEAAMELFDDDDGDGELDEDDDD